MRILLADGQPDVRFALRVLLERQPGLSIVGEVADVTDLLAQAEMAAPNLVLLSWELPGWAAKRSFIHLRRIRPDLSVIALSGRPEVRRAALDAGADAFVGKGEPPERLLEAIEGCRTGVRGRAG